MDIGAIFIENWWRILLTAAAAYLLGSINTAVIVTKIVTKGKDIRTMGSGNAGFTNVLRSVGKAPAVWTIVCDFLKGIAAVLIGALIFSTEPVSGEILRQEYMAAGKYIGGLFCILGHSYPLYFHFKGGKGVVTAAALILMADWRVFIAVIATFLILFLITKIISIASIASAFLFGFYTFGVVYLLDYGSGAGFSWAYVIFSTAAAFLIGIFVIVKHKDNIRRILRGEEKKITARK